MKIDLQTIQTVVITDTSKKSERSSILADTISSLGLKAKFHQAHMEKKIRDYNPGCSRSHLTALESHTAPFLLLEDDVKPTKWFSRHIEVPDDAEAIYLGYSLAGTIRDRFFHFDVDPEINGWRRVKKLLATHAILYLSETYKQACIDNIRNSMSRLLPMDLGFTEIQNQHTIYCPSRPLLYQWDKCWITTYVEIKENEWISHHPDGTPNFTRGLDS